MALIELNDVSFTYPAASVPALKNFSLKVDKGEFVVIVGPSGCGKSTLLRMLKKELSPHGITTGTISVNGSHDTPGHKVGFVFQDPENQVVADEVLNELVFGLENMGIPTNEMRNKVAEMVHFFGAESLLSRKTHELSGGQKQQMNLASVLLMQPDILLLDEPTAQLDPVSSREFLDMLVRLNEEFGMTIILVEHRLEEVFSYADKIILMEEGSLKIEGTPQEVLKKMWSSSRKNFVPSIPALFLRKLDESSSIPLNVKEGRQWISKKCVKQVKKVVPHKDIHSNEVLKVNDLFFQFDKTKEWVIKELSFTLRKGELYTLLGGNGSGKSTFLKLLCGILKPQQGKIFLGNKRIKNVLHNSRDIGYLPQNPKLFFIQDTVGQEIQSTMNQWGIKDNQLVESLLERLNISHLLDSHPHDLSGGELQKAALVCILLRNPSILLLDEPTKGLDPISRVNLVEILQGLQSKGVSILMSTHDVEFAAKHANTCGMMFQGSITAQASPRSFFKGNFFYTTMIQRLFRHLPDFDIVTIEEAEQLWD